MRLGYKIACPNRSKGGHGICGRTLKITDRLQTSGTEILYCMSCGCQAHVEFNPLGACKITIPSVKVLVETEPYPLAAEGEYSKK